MHVDTLIDRTSLATMFGSYCQDLWLDLAMLDSDRLEGVAVRIRLSRRPVAGVAS
jgi:hypothetical protein